MFASSKSRRAAETKEVGYLSGGNQQKIVIARWLFADADLFILDEPTQGIDIGARIAVYRLINGLTAAGKGVILISSDDDELLSMSDRVGIMSHGRWSASIARMILMRRALVRASAGAGAGERQRDAHPRQSDRRRAQRDDPGGGAGRG